MNLHPTTPRWREFYDKTAPALALLCLVVALFAVGWSYMNDRQNRQQDEQRIADAEARADDNARLLACFDDFATTLAGGLPVVREATQDRNAALAEVLHSLEVLVTASLKTPPPTEEEGAAIVRRLGEALAKFRETDTALLAAQQQNPYPDPPSEFCPPDTSLPPTPTSKESP